MERKSIKRICQAVLGVVCIMSFLFAPTNGLTVKADTTVDNQLFMQRFEEVKSRYRQGEYWEYRGDDGTHESSAVCHAYHSGPCIYGVNCDESCSCGWLAYYPGQAPIGDTCWGFARMIQGVIFGHDYGSVNLSSGYTVYDLWPGDVIDLSGTWYGESIMHTVMVWAVEETGNGDAIIRYADANHGGPCRITYDNYYTRSELLNSGAGITVYREPNSNTKVSSTITYANVEAGQYYFKNLGTGKCLDVSGGVDEEQRNIGVYTFHGDSNQVMNVIKESQGYIFRPECSTGRIVNPFVVELCDGGNINLLTNYQGDNTQRWVFEAVEGGYVIRNLQNTYYVMDTDGTNAYVYHYMQGNKNQIWVLEKKVDVTGVKLNTTSVTMEIDSNKTLSATISPSNATYKSKTWTSNNTSVATVDSNGKVKAVGLGTAKITCQVDGYKAECSVKVVGHALTGQIRLDGEPKYGETLMVVVTNSNNTGTKYYQWQRDGVDVAGRNATLYPLAQDDIGKTITCVVTSSIETGKLTASAVISKADGPAIPTGLTTTKPSVKGAADGKICGTTTAMEYATKSDFSNKTVCTGTEITGLTAGTYYIRYAETKTHKAGVAVDVTVPEGKASVDARAPKLNSATISNGTVIFTWTANEGVDKYAVFRKVDSGSWKKISETSQTSYIDSTVAEGHTYSYTARGMNENGKYITAYDTTGVSVTMATTEVLDKSSPVLGSAKAGVNGTTFTWTANSGVFKYAVFRKEAGGNYAKVAETTGSGNEGVKAVAGATCRYIDTTAVAGKTYVYTVRGMNEAGKYVTSYNVNGVTATGSQAEETLDKSNPVLGSAVAGTNGVTFTWTANSGVFKYAVFRKETGGKYAKVAETTGSGTEGVKATAGASCSYVDTTTVAGKTYVYTVRGMSEAGKYVTSYDTNGVSATAK